MTELSLFRFLTCAVYGFQSLYCSAHINCVIMLNSKLKEVSILTQFVWGKKKYIHPIKRICLQNLIQSKMKNLKTVHRRGRLIMHTSLSLECCCVWVGIWNQKGRGRGTGSCLLDNLNGSKDRFYNLCGLTALPDSCRLRSDPQIQDHHQTVISYL